MIYAVENNVSLVIPALRTRFDFSQSNRKLQTGNAIAQLQFYCGNSWLQETCHWRFRTGYSFAHHDLAFHPVVLVFVWLHLFTPDLPPLKLFGCVCKLQLVNENIYDQYLLFERCSSSLKRCSSTGTNRQRDVDRPKVKIARDRHKILNAIYILINSWYRVQKVMVPCAKFVALCAKFPCIAAVGFVHVVLATRFNFFYTFW